MPLENGVKRIQRSTKMSHKDLEITGAQNAWCWWCSPCGVNTTPPPHSLVGFRTTEHHLAPSSKNNPRTGISRCWIPKHHPTKFASKSGAQHLSEEHLKTPCRTPQNATLETALVKANKGRNIFINLVTIYRSLAVRARIISACGSGR